jgi:DEAD/DEAH box helicase domain-containing protein
LENHGVVHATGGTWHWAADSYPANNVSLRSIGWHNVVVVDVENDRSFAEMDWRAAHTMLHDRAIYQHDGETWQVERFDYENNKAFVRKVKPDYFTTAMTNKKLSVIETSASSEIPAATAWGDVSVVEKVVGYKKIKFHTHENAGYGEVMLPEMQMHTTAFWMTFSDVGAKIDGIRGIGHALETVSTLALMCEPCDLGTSLSQEIPTRPTLYLHEQVPGGTGLAERIFELRETLLKRTHDMIASCPCRSGCPACVGPSEERRKRIALEILRGLVSGYAPGP